MGPEYGTRIWDPNMGPEYRTRHEGRKARTLLQFFPVFGTALYCPLRVAKRPASTPSAKALMDRVHRSIADQVRKTRKAQGRTARDVMVIARVGSDRVSRIESQDHGADGLCLGPLCRIADALGCELEVRLVQRRK